MRLIIVIPFFQRQPGILRRALTSIAAQERVFERASIDQIRLIVVDDESPVGAESEVEGIDFPANLHCQVVHQDNRGPGGARNRGLDLAGDDDVIAFLDSDDEWTPDHLDRAVTAMQAGYDVYGSNWVPLGDHADAMSMPARQSLKLKATRVLDAAGEIDGDPLISEMTAPMCKLSGLVYNGRRFAGLRFDERFRNASEDVLFIYAMMCSEPRVMISTQAEVRSGRGVNIYESAKWGSAERLSVIYDQTLATKLAQEVVAGRPGAMAKLGRNLADQRRSFAANMWHMLLHARLPLRQAARQLRLDPAVVFSILAYPVDRVRKR